MSDSSRHAADTPPPFWHRPRGPLLLFAALAILLIGWQSPMALLMLFYDGMLPVVVLACASGCGLWVLWPLRLESAPLRWQLLIGAATGIGCLCLLMLLLGLTSHLRPVHVGALGAAMGLAAIAAIRRLWQRCLCEQGATVSGFHYLWILIVPFLVVAVLGACLPPGILWAEEGLGYDELEYHLGLAKEYYLAGRIGFMPHNVYANFPANAEMLFLLADVLKGDVWEATYAAKLFNVAFACLTVAAAWVVGRDISPRAGILAGVLMGTAGWLPYLAGIAFVEPGMLFFGMASAGAMTRCVGPPPAGEQRWSWALAAGLLAGFACGFKYTAVPLIALPVGAAVLTAVLEYRPRRLLLPVHFALGCAVTFSPSLVKNYRMTGNPFFPLFYGVFGAKPGVWDAELDDTFVRGHQPRDHERSVAAKTGQLGRALFTERDQRIGWLLPLAAAAGLVLSRRRNLALITLETLCLQLACWFYLTHLYARFIVPVLIPLVLLAAPLAARTERRAFLRALAVLVVAGAILNTCFIARLYAQHVYPGGRRLDAEGATSLFLDGQWPGQAHLGYINNRLPGGSKLLMVGDARAFYVKPPVDYCVVFNRSPFVEQVRRQLGEPDGPARIVAWLQRQGYTHVYVGFAEIERLRRSEYGFAQEITPELFGKLTRAGLERLEMFTFPGRERPYGAIYRVPPRQD